MATPLLQRIDDLTQRSQMQPVTADFDETQGVAGRTDSIIKTDSPLMQMAATRAKQQAQASGLRNSSMAVGAGQRAVLEAAVPIASADAQLSAQQRLTNQAAKNNANQFNAGTTASLGSEGLRMEESGRQFDVQTGNQASQFGQSLMEQARQFNAGAGLKREELAQSQRQFDTSTGARKEEFGQTLGLQREQLTAQREQFAQQLGIDVRQLDQARDQMTQQQQQFLAELDLKGQQLAQQGKQSEAQLAMQKTIATMDAENRLALAKAEADFKTDIGGNENISNAWGSTMEYISRIQNNPDLEEDAKKALIQNQINGFKSFTSFWKKTTGGAVDVSDLLNFGMTGGAGGSGGADGSAPARKPAVPEFDDARG